MLFAGKNPEPQRKLVLVRDLDLDTRTRSVFPGTDPPFLQRLWQLRPEVSIPQNPSASVLSASEFTCARLRMGVTRRVQRLVTSTGTMLPLNLNSPSGGSHSLSRNAET